MQTTAASELREFATDQVAAGQRASYWADVVSRIHSPLDFISDSKLPYDAHLIDRSFRDYRVSESTTGPSRAHRTRHHIRRDKEFKFEVVASLKGGFRLTHLGKEVECNPGTFVIVDNSEEYYYQNPDVTQTLNIHLPRRLVFDRFIDPHAVCGVALSFEDAFTHHAIEMLLSLLRQRDGWSECAVNSICNSILDLLAISIQENLHIGSSERSVQFAVLARIRSYIRSNLQDESLSPSSIAGACGISKSYLHKLFESTNMTVGQFLLSNRLSSARSMLKNPIYGHLPVSQICFNCGFSSHSHFSRTYKDKYGISPSDERS